VEKGFGVYVVVFEICCDSGCRSDRDSGPSTSYHEGYRGETGSALDDNPPSRGSAFPSPEEKSVPDCLQTGCRELCSPYCLECSRVNVIVAVALPCSAVRPCESSSGAWRLRGLSPWLALAKLPSYNRPTHFPPTHCLALLSIERSPA
jgi:hypothetical protein